MARTAGYGAKDASGNFYFKALGDGEIKLGNSSDDLVEITGTIEQNGTSFQISGDDARIKINGDTDSHPGLEFHENGSRHWIVYNDYTTDNLTFKSSADRVVITDSGRLGIGTTSPDYKLDVAGNISLNEHLYHNGDGDTRVSFPAANQINLVAGGKSVFKFASSTITLNNGNNDIDTKIMADNGQEVVFVNAGNNRVGINTTSPSVDFDVNGTTKSNYYITTPSTQDLGSGTSSTLSIGSSLMFLDADSITGTDPGIGQDIHTLNIPNGATSGQRLTLVIEGNMGAGNSVPIMLAGNLMGAFDMFMPGSKTSLNLVFYSTSAGSVWYQV